MSSDERSVVGQRVVGRTLSRLDEILENHRAVRPHLETCQEKRRRLKKGTARRPFSFIRHFCFASHDALLRGTATRKARTPCKTLTASSTFRTRSDARPGDSAAIRSSSVRYTRRASSP